MRKSSEERDLANTDLDIMHSQSVKILVCCEEISRLVAERHFEVGT